MDQHFTTALAAILDQMACALQTPDFSSLSLSIKAQVTKCLDTLYRRRWRPRNKHTRPAVRI